MWRFLHHLPYCSTHSRGESNTVFGKHLDGWPLVNTSCQSLLVHSTLRRDVLIINISVSIVSTEMGTSPILSLLVQYLYTMTHPTPVLKMEAACKSNTLGTLPTSTQCKDPKESTSTEFPFTIMWQGSLQVFSFLLLYIFSLTLYILYIYINNQHYKLGPQSWLNLG
jgi:hypothetical protein